MQVRLNLITCLCFSFFIIFSSCLDGREFDDSLLNIIKQVFRWSSQENPADKGGVKDSKKIINDALNNNEVYIAYDVNNKNLRYERIDLASGTAEPSMKTAATDSGKSIFVFSFYENEGVVYKVIVNRIMPRAYFSVEYVGADKDPVIKYVSIDIPDINETSEP